MASEGFCFWSFLRFTGKFLGEVVGFVTVTIAA